MAYQGNHPLSDDVKHNPHVRQLLSLHEDIEEQLRAEMASPGAREDRIRKLKLQKLHVTEKIMKLRQ